ncbi:MAG: hypothetical protein AAFO94_16970, partial [Bacteroidota bacterium]
MMKHSFLLIFLFSLFLVPFSTEAQQAAAGEAIEMYNPSFEDMPRASRQPRGWLNCGWSDESPPDVQPDTTFAVSQEPYHGKTYLGMVTRDNDTWESIGQRLSKELEPGQKHTERITLARLQ